MADLPAPKPFYRSRLFWFGIPGLLFLIWVWISSMTMGRWMVFYEPHRNVWMGVIGGTIDFKLFHQKTFVGPEVRFVRERVGFIRRRAVPPSPSRGDYSRPEPLGGMLDHEMENPFPRAISLFQRSELDQRVSYRIGISFWFVLVVSLSIWSLSLYCWQCRKTRLARISATLLP